MDWEPELDVSDRALAAGVQAFAARVLAEAEAAENAGVAFFEDFGVGDAAVGAVLAEVKEEGGGVCGFLFYLRVGHVSVHAALALPVGTCSRAAGDGLVVPKAIDMGARLVFAARAKGEVVAATLTRSAGAESEQHDVGDALRSKYVAADDTGTFGGTEQ